MICHDCNTEMIRWQIPPAAPIMFCPLCGRKYTPHTRAVTPGDRRRARAAAHAGGTAR